MPATRSFSAVYTVRGSATGKLAEHDGVEHGEDRGGSADSQCQRQDSATVATSGVRSRTRIE